MNQDKKERIWLADVLERKRMMKDRMMRERKEEEEEEEERAGYFMFNFGGRRNEREGTPNDNFQLIIIEFN